MKRVQLFFQDVPQVVELLLHVIIFQMMLSCKIQFDLSGSQILTVKKYQTYFFKA